MNAQNEYRSLMLRKVQQVAQEHGGISNIPRAKQKELGFDIIAGRKGSFSISVRIPEGNLEGRISELKSELPPITFQSAKPEPEKIFGKYTPRVSEENPTMDDFWIMQGWHKEGKTGIRLTNAKWQDDEKVRAEAVRFLVEKFLKKDPRDITQGDFCSNRLSGLLSNYYNGSAYLALLEAGYHFHPWEMARTPRDIYNSKENRAAAVKWLIEKLKKDPRGLTEEDFLSNRLGGLLVGYYNGSPYAALLEAGYSFHPWEMKISPAGAYKSKENRVAAIKWLVEKLQKDPTDIAREDLLSNGLGGLVDYYNGSPYAALLESGCGLHPWEMKITPNGVYSLRENRVAATRWLAEKLQKDPRDTIQEDFYSNRLGGLLVEYYNNSPYEALLEAGLVAPQDEGHMRSKRHTHKS